MSNPVGVIYLSYDGMTDNLGQSQVIPYLIGLRQEGYVIHIVSCEKSIKYENRKSHIEQMLQKYAILWHPLLYTAKPPVVSTLYDMHCMQREVVSIISNKENNIKLLHCRSYITAHVGVFCKKKFGIPWIFDMRGFWADERVEGGIWNTQKILYRKVYQYFKNFEQKCIANANTLICLTHNGANEIRTWKSYKQAQPSIFVIPCCADLQLFTDNHSREKQMRRSLKIPDNSFILSYLGSFGTWYMTEEMFDFFARLYRQNNQSIFLCITPDSPDMIESMAIKKDIPTNAIRVVKANREDVPAYASLSNWSLFFIKPVYSKKASSPTKMGELLALGIPLVCNAGVGDVDAIMQDCPQGAVIQHYTNEEYDEIAQKILSTRHITHQALRAVAEKYYSLDKGVQTYLEAYNTTLQ